MRLFLMKTTDRKLGTLRRKLTIYVARPSNCFPGGILFVAYWHTDDSKTSIIDPFFYEHVARDDLEGKMSIWPVSDTEFAWDFQNESSTDALVKLFMLDLYAQRGLEINAFIGRCWTAIEKNPWKAFQVAFR